MFATIFIIGALLIFALGARLSDSDGIDQREGATLLVLAILTALALLMATVIRVTEIRHAHDGDYDDDPDEDDQPQADPVHLSGYARPSVREDPDRRLDPKLASWIPSQQTEHTLNRTWDVRPDSEDTKPTGTACVNCGSEDPATRLFGCDNPGGWHTPAGTGTGERKGDDEPGTAEKIRQARERGERT